MSSSLASAGTAVSRQLGLGSIACCTCAASDCRCRRREQEALASRTDPEPTRPVFRWRNGVFLPRANFLTKTAKALLLRYRRSTLAPVAADGGQWDLHEGFGDQPMRTPEPVPTEYAPDAAVPAGSPPPPWAKRLAWILLGSAP